MNKSKSF